ncbi:MAG: ATP-binding protein [Flavobacteriaceae bacterium]
MINKRLLVKVLLAHNDENSFYDKKLRIDLSRKEGKAKFLKHVCALSNSNPANNSYIVIGVSDQQNKIVGVDFFDDSKLQNLVNAYLENPPRVTYENIPFPHLPIGKVVGLITIFPNPACTALRKNIWKYYGGSVFIREGSISQPKKFGITLQDINSSVVETIEHQAQNNIQLTLDGVVDFLNQHQGEKMQSEYRVFKETFVLCWAGIEKKVKDKTYYSRVDIELINEQVKLFYSNLDEVEISWDKDAFTITEYVQLGIHNDFRFFPLEKVAINFQENGTYQLQTELLFEPPRLDRATLLHRFNANNALLDKLEKKIPLSLVEQEDLYQLPSSYMLCYLNLIHAAKEQLHRSRPLLKSQGAAIYEAYKETQRILRKIKYN